MQDDILVGSIPALSLTLSLLDSATEPSPRFLILQERNER